MYANSLATATSNFPLILSLLWALVFTQTAMASGSPSGIFNVLDFGASGDGKTLDTASIQKAIDACDENGGGQVLLPAGKTFLSGGLTLRACVDFHLANGAVLRGSENWRDYLPTGALLFAKDAPNIALSGDGTIDGNDWAIWQKLADEEVNGNLNEPDWWPESFIGQWWPFGKKLDEPDKKGGRPMMVIFIGCNRVRIRDLTLRAAPSWTVHLVGCEDVAVTGISIHNSWDIANCDGIDIDHCRGVRVADCLMECADDCVVIKNTPNFEKYGDCEHITVTGCTLKSRSAALKVDEIYTGTARDIVFDACVVSGSNRGLAIQARDVGNIENVVFSNIVVETKFFPHKWWGAGEPIQVTQYPRTAQTTLGRVRNIRFSHILCRGENGLVFQGWPANPIEDIVLDDVKMELTPAPKGTSAFQDFRPAGLFQGVVDAKPVGLYVHDVRNFAIFDSRIVWADPGNAHYGPAIDRQHADHMEIENLKIDSLQSAK
jgi:polygalacturonase